MSLTRRIHDLNKDKGNYGKNFRSRYSKTKTRIEIALTYIFGIGKSRAQQILEKAGVDVNKKVSDWNDDEIGRIRDAVSAFTIEGELRSEIQ